MSDELETFEVPETLAGERVDRAVALLTGFSRADVQTLVAEGSVTVDDETVAKSRRLRAGEVLSVTGRPAPPEVPSAEPVEFDVAHEDADLLVVVKPPGLVVHPGAGNEHGTLVHGLLERYPEIAEVGDRMRPGIVHRLDRDTSGLMLVARSSRAHDALGGMLAARQVERRYLALVWGVPEPARGRIEAPIGRSRRNPTRMAVTPSGREARTHYEVRERFGLRGVALVAAALDSGRTHQIRVHLAAIEHPVVGDAVYGGAREGVDIERPFLHAYRLGCNHPVTRERLAFEAPLSDDLRSVLEGLRSRG